MAEEDFDNNKDRGGCGKGQYGCRKNKLSLEQIKDIADYVEYKCVKLNRARPLRSRIWWRTRSCLQAHLSLQRIMWRWSLSALPYARPIQRITAFFPLIECNNEDVKQGKFNKRIQRSTVCRGITWPGRSAGPDQEDAPSQDIVEADMRASSISMTRLFCPAHAQLRPGEPGGHAAERHGYQRDQD